MIVYCPYKSVKYFPLATGFFALGNMIIVLCSIPYNWKITTFFSISCIALIYLTKRVYAASKTAIHFDEKGMRLIGDKTGEKEYIPYEEINYLYHLSDGKAYYYVMATQLYDVKKARRLLNRVADSSKMYVDNAVVIHMDKFQETTEVKKWIEDSGHFPPVTELRGQWDWLD